MDIGLYVALVAVAAIVYAAATRVIQNRMVDRSKMEALQADSKRLNDEYKKATERNDKKRMAAIMDEQVGLFKKMNEMMLAQMKPFAIIIVVFLSFMFVVNSLNPTLGDDTTISTYDDGTGCDQSAGDGRYTACVPLGENTNFGKWTVTASAYEGGAVKATNECYFLYNTESRGDTYIEKGTGEGMEVRTDKEAYYPGETVVITAVPAEMTKGSDIDILGLKLLTLASPKEFDVDKVEMKVSNGTYFYVDLPFAIPVLNVQRIFQPQWWFILVSMLSGITISFVLKRTGVKL